MAQGSALRDDNRQIATIVQNLLGTLPIYLTGINLTNANALHVAMVDGSGTQITAFGGIAQADNSTFTASTTQGTPAFGFYHSTIDTVTDGRAAALAIDSKRNLFTVLRDAAGNARGVNVTANNELLVGVGTGTTALGKAEDSAHASGDTGVMLLAVRNDTGAVLAGTDGDYVPITTDSSGAVRIDINGTISTNNSSTATLTSGSIFTGTADDSLIYNEIRVSVFSNVASATDGLSIQQSQDNSNWDITDVYTVAAATGSTFAVPRQARYVRIVYTNGGTNQGSFRLQTILNRTGTMASSQRPSDAYTNQTDLEQVQAFGMVYNGTTWDRVREAINALNSIGTGIFAAQMVAQFDDVSPTAITENQFGNLRMSANRNAYTTLRDAAGNERGANVDANNNLGVVLAAETTKVLGTIRNVGNVGGVFDAATAATVPANALYKGLRGTTALPTAVTDGQLVGGMGDKYGRHVALISTIRDLVITQTTTISASTSETTIGTAVSSVFLDIIMLIVSNTSTATNTRIDFRDTTAGSILFSLQSNGGQPPIGFSLATPIPQTSVNTNWTAQCGTSTTDLRVYLVTAKNK